MAKNCVGHMVKLIEMRFEPLSYMLLNGLSDLAFQAWYELESGNEGAVYDVDWEAYQRMENSNQLRFVSLRASANLIGYAAIVVQSDLNQFGLVVATLKDIYIIPEKRGHAASFVRFIERQLSEVGVKRVIAGEKLNASTPNAASEFYKLIGYAPFEIRLAKTLH